MITVNPDLRNLLRAESTKRRDFDSHSTLLTPELRQAAKELKNHPDIIIRKADKSNVLVVLDKQEYKNKLDSILSDTTKFTKIKRDTTKSLKTDVNKLIAAANKSNKKNEPNILNPIVGEYSPGYLYGTVKTHKKGNPLRPIISQVTTPIYETAKHLNKLISPYMPAEFMLNSTDELLDILRVFKPEGNLASLDVESLFTNVPVKTTINIICDAIYRTPSADPFPISERILRELLLACTTKSPFRHIDGSLYRQIDGVAMGSPLGVTFANFYMCHAENQVMNLKKPPIYCRYVDDCLVVVNDQQDLLSIKASFEAVTVLKFTFEESDNHRINFLDVKINAMNDSYQTSVYHKPTHQGIYLNAMSECPDRYKTGTIKALIHRIYKISSNWEIFHSSIANLKQTIINNGYSNSMFDKLLHDYLQKRLTVTDNVNVHDPQPSQSQIHTVFYKNQYSSSYKTDEKVLRNLIYKNTYCNNENHKLKLIIYYNSNVTAKLVMKNSPSVDNLQTSNVIYEFKCKEGECELLAEAKYIGMTTTTLSRRLTMHLQSGAIKKHLRDVHKRDLTRQDLVDNTTIAKHVTDFSRLQVLEALRIAKVQPVLNQQATGSARTLLLFGNK